LSSLAVVNGLLVSITSVYKSVADELGDDLGIQGTAVVEVRLIGGLERVLLAAVEARAEHDGWVRALVEVSGVGKGRIAGPTTRSSGDVGEVGLEAKGSVEGVSLSATLLVLGSSGSTGPASIDSRSGSLAPISEDVADRVEHDLGVESATLRELGLVHRFEGALAQLAIFESGTKLDCRIFTATQIKATRRGYAIVGGCRGRGLGSGGSG